MNQTKPPTILPHIFITSVLITVSNFSLKWKTIKKKKNTQRSFTLVSSPPIRAHHSHRKSDLKHTLIFFVFFCNLNYEHCSFLNICGYFKLFC